MSFLPSGSNANRGTDRSIIVTDDSTGATINFGGRLNKVTWSDSDTLLKSTGIDQGGREFGIVVPGGKTGTITIERARGDAQRFKAFLDAQFYAGQAQPTFTITQKTDNSYDSSTDNVKLTNVVFHNYKDGDWDNKTLVMVSIEFFATEAIAL